jgi:uncharacterized Zn-binding protein involved in type VI secretion
MSKLITVDGDKVEGTDKHNVAGTATVPPPTGGTAPYTGVADFDYKGKMADALSDFVNIGGKAAAIVTSKSRLNPGEDTPAGKHHGMQGSGFVPPGPNKPMEATMSITDPVGEGKPSSTAGSSFVNIGGDAVLLDGDKIDTCDGLSIPMNSTVTAQNQDFVSCSQ